VLQAQSVLQAQRVETVLQELQVLKVSLVSLVL
jgi:hypothetical protein